MNRDSIRQLFIILTVLVLIVMNVLANALPFNDITTGEVSDQFDVFFVPAGYVFAIWGVIYLGLLTYAFFQALPVHRSNPRLRAIFWPFVISSVANVAWLFCWHYGYFALTVILMLIILASLIVIYLKLNVNRVKIVPGERWLVHIPFSIYLGWISVATIANITNYLWLLGWNGFGITGEMWAAIMLGVGVILAYLMVFFRKDVAFLLVFVWAFIGIAVKQADTPLVATTAWISAALVGLGVVLSYVLKARSQQVKQLQLRDKKR